MNNRHPLAQLFMEVLARYMLESGKHTHRVSSRHSGVGRDRRKDKFEEPNKHLRAYRRRYAG